ncbi:putative Integral membrane protein [Seiridium cardinale]|uniref:Integral membrane protein n=1 Tax=Seiridium cardinale TaxID=138064 RepID=A0ABR2X6Y1_9PEZI
MTPRLQSQRHPSHAHHIAGPVPFLNPTKAYVDAGNRQPQPAAESANGDAKAESSGTAPGVKPVAAPGVYHLWRSRDNRKGRHAVVVPPGEGREDGHGVVSHPSGSDTLRGLLRGLQKMVVRYPIWDVSYDVATIFTLGSVVWVFNGFFVWLPVQDPPTEFSGEVDSGGGITAFIGATIFEIGSVLLMFEAVNENRTDCFGWALEEALESRGSVQLRPNPASCSHHHVEKRSFITRKDSSGDTTRSWEWWPTAKELRTHYFREIGFLACFSQFIGATIFWIAGLTGLPPIYDALSVPVANGIYWLPQVVGGSGFIISGWLFMLETQPNWYTPAFGTLGWHIGFWNLIGAFGFTICGALGFASENESAAYASVLATFIGSWAFLLGSVIQWYESLDKYPITVGKGAMEKRGSPSGKE